MLFLAMPAIVCADDEQTQRQLVDGLRQRRLYDLADHVCLEHLENENSSAVLQANMGIELIKTKTARATNAPDNMREQLWGEAHNGGNEFFTRFPSHPRRELVEVQRATTWLTRGKTLAFELQAGWGGQQKRDEVDTVLARAIQELGIKQRDIEKLIPAQRRTNLGEDELTALQLQALANNVLFQISQAHRYRAMFEQERVNFEDSLRQSLKMLDNLKLQVDVNDPLFPKCELDRAICFRMLGRLNEAEKILARLQQEAPDDSEILAEQLQLAVARKDVDRIKTYLDLLSTFRMRSAELDVLLMQSTLELASLARGESDKALFQKRAVDMSNSINERHGNYWGSRARMLLINVAPVGAGNSADMKAAMAQRAYQQQRWEEATSAFRAAAKIASESQDQERAFRWFRMAAAIEQQQKEFLKAAESYRALALQFSGNDQAGDVHLLACWNYSQQLNSQQNGLDTYANWLVEHIETFGQHNSSNRAHYWYAKVLAHQKQWQTAIDQCFGIEVADPDFAAAVNLAGQCGANLLTATPAGPEREKIRGELVSKFSQVMSEDLDQPGTAWRESDRQAIIAIANIAIDNASSLTIDVASLLKNAIDESDIATKAWIEEARTWRVLYLARESGNESAIDQALRGVDPTTDNIERLLIGLTRLNQDSNPSVAKAKVRCFEFAQKNWDAISELRQTQWQLIHAQGLYHGGDQQRGIAMYGQLAKQHPKSISIQLEYARSMSSANSVADPGQALAQWRRIAAGTAKHSEAWFEAKYNVAQFLVSTGESDRAKDMLRLIKLVAPKEPKSVWLQKMDQLLAELDG